MDTISVLAKKSSPLQYTGRFSVKFGVQCWQLHNSHPDTHYVNTLLQYVKTFTVKYKEFTLYASADDKAIFPIGEPDLPILTGVRGHQRSLVPAGGSKVVALGHDFHVQGIVPSVVLFVSIPDNIYGKFYRGKVVVTLKIKLPSHQVQCAMPQTELAEVVGAKYSSDT